ncbi:MAG TPA: SDR family NAD(P)-dependent oxidoreductase, partial [Ktedonobacteraceae bacterium]|nr:SDR family NAD(P)-dependent oxidoreductase [Ktedonobacteraceae bacterium]
IEYGSSFQVLKEVRYGAGVAVGALELSSESNQEGYSWSPGLLDGALQTSIGLLKGEPQQERGLGLPFAVQRVEQWAEVPSTAWAVVRASKGDSAALRKLDVAIVDGQGRVALQLSGFSTRPVQESGNGAASSKAMVPAEVPEVLSAPVLVGELTLAPVWEVSEERTEAWPGAAQRVIWLRADREAPLNGLMCDAPVQTVAFESTDSREVLTERLGAQTSWQHVVWQVPRGERLVAVMGLRLIQALLALGYSKRSLGLTVVTRQGQVVWPRERAEAEQASVHGLIGSLAKEYPHWRVRVLDLAVGEPLPTDWQALPADAQGEVRAYRKGQWYRQRLVPCRLQEVRTPVYRLGGVYVVLGGAGGIGVAFSEYLIRRYQAQLVWLGRRAEDETIRQQCVRLGTLGPRPLYLQADATDRDALELASTTIRERFGVIHGVVHSAIVLADRSLGAMDEASFEAALSAKTTTTVNLDSVFGSEGLDFLAFFSSMQSFTKAAGQSNYAAGCCFADAFADGLRHREYAVKVMHWGYWGSVGVVATEPYRERMARMGLGSIEPPEGMAALERLLAGPLDRVAFLKTTQGSVAQLLGVSEQVRVEMALEAPVVRLPRAAAVALPEVAGEALRSLEELLARLLWARLASLGWLRGDIIAPARYVRWGEAAQRLLRARGIRLEEQAPAWETAWAQWESYRQSVGEDAALGAQVRLVDATLQALPEILSGKRAATEVLFPQGGVNLVEGIYRDQPVADYFNAVLAERLEAYVQRRLEQDRQIKLRILEIGAGTGGTSRKLFERLTAYVENIEKYCYTDVSATFLLHAQEHYQTQAPYLRTQRLDIERSPVMQGFTVGSYDVVVAANVLHATRAIRRTVRQTKTLLKKNGLLLLNELSATSVFAHLSFGLLEGWWLAKDRPLRFEDSPGLAPELWEQVLSAEGFKSIEVPAEAAHRLGQQIVVATSDGVVQVERETVSMAAPERSISPSQVSVAVMSQEDGLQEAAERYLARLVAGSLKLPVERIDAQAPLEQYGIDSLMVVSLTRQLEGTFGPLPATLFFEYQSLAAVTQYFLEHHAGALAGLLGKQNQAQLPNGDLPSDVAVPAPLGSRRRRRGLRVPAPASTLTRGPLDIAIVGLSGRYPKAKTVAEYWANLIQGVDCITQIPLERWDWRDYFDSHKGREGKSYSKWGGFLEGVDWFDPLFFNISPREAEVMDPQERLFLQCAYSAIEDAGYTRESFGASAGSNGWLRQVGVFVGVMYEEYQ